MLFISKIGNALKMAILLQSRGKMKATELAQELEVSERQIRKYRDDLEQASIFITSKFGTYGGYELLSNNNLLGLNVKQQDVITLDMINEQIKVNDDIYKDEFTELVDKIKAVANMKNDSVDHMNYFIVQSKANCNFEEEKKKYRDISIAFMTKKKVEITYYSLNSNSTSKRIVHPYGLYSYKSDKYMVAYCEKREAVIDFKLCRIYEYTVLDEKFEVKSSFNWGEYSQNCIGIYKDKEIDIKLKISHPHSVIIKEKIWVDNQEIEEKEDGAIIFSATMKGYTEIKSWILSMGSYVEVLEPKKLREDIVLEIERIKNIY